MRFTMEDVHDMLMEENPQLQIQILEDGNMEVVAPSTFVEDPEMMEELQHHVMKILSMAATMGMFFPNEMTSMLSKYTEIGEKTNGE